jgi:hypothetical protein
MCKTSIVVIDVNKCDMNQYSGSTDGVDTFLMLAQILLYL